MSILVQGSLCNGPSLPPPSHFSNCPLSCSHKKLLALMQISHALPSFTCFWASAVSSIWRTLCFSGSPSSSWKIPHRYHFSGHFPWPYCMCIAPCTSSMVSDCIQMIGASPPGLFAPREASLCLLEGAVWCPG